MIEMKNSGIDWIGEIPAQWEVDRVKAFAKAIKGKSSDYLIDPTSDSYQVLSVESLRQGECQFYDYVNVDDESQICTPNDIVVIWDGAGVGEFLKAKNGALSSTIAKIQFTNKKVLPNYFWYWRYKVEYRLKSIPTGMGIPHLNPTLLNNYKIAIPPLAEQQAIADYLDEKTAEIDVQVALLEKKCESYNKLKRSLISKVVTRGLNPSVELKDSCNEWIGEIPAHWEIRRLKDVASLYTGNSLNETQKEYYATNSFSESLPYIGSKDVELGVGKINYGGDYRIPVGESKFCVAPNGSSLLCVEGGSAGKKVGYVEQDVCFVNKLCCIYSQQNKKFIYYYLFSLEFANQFNARLQGMIGGVSINIIKAMSIALPPLKEQQSIADYLDNKTAEIDEQIELIDKKINTYKKLKQSLIDEVVTGKRKI